MRLSLQVIYAVCGIFDLAYNGEGGPVRVRAIGERQRIPARYLEQIFQRLRKAGLVTSKRGPGGGYTLARPPAEINLRHIVEAVEGPLDEDPAGEGAEAESSPCRPDFLWDALASRIRGVLEEVTVESMCRDASHSAVQRAGADAYHYHI
ncbi:MAG: RrF2 family transcriptional regulator [Myxococcota bacterium]